MSWYTNQHAIFQQMAENSLANFLGKKPTPLPQGRPIMPRGGGLPRQRTVYGQAAAAQYDLGGDGGGGVIDLTGDGKEEVEDEKMDIEEPAPPATKQENKQETKKQEVRFSDIGKVGGSKQQEVIDLTKDENKEQKRLKEQEQERLKEQEQKRLMQEQERLRQKRQVIAKGEAHRSAHVAKAANRSAVEAANQAAMAAGWIKQKKGAEREAVAMEEMMRLATINRGIREGRSSWLPKVEPKPQQSAKGMIDALNADLQENPVLQKPKKMDIEQRGGKHDDDPIATKTVSVEERLRRQQEQAERKGEVINVDEPGGRRKASRSRERKGKSDPPEVQFLGTKTAQERREENAANVIDLTKESNTINLDDNIWRGRAGNKLKKKLLEKRPGAKVFDLTDNVWAGIEGKNLKQEMIAIQKNHKLTDTFKTIKKLSKKNQYRNTATKVILIDDGKTVTKAKSKPDITDCFQKFTGKKMATTIFENGLIGGQFTTEQGVTITFAEVNRERDRKIPDVNLSTLGSGDRLATYTAGGKRVMIRSEGRRRRTRNTEWESAKRAQSTRKIKKGGDVTTAKKEKK